MRREAKLVGAFFVALGLVAVLGGTSLLFGVSSQSEGLSCKALCGLSLLIAQLLGTSAGTFTAGLLYVAAGVSVTFVGYSVLRGSRCA